MTITTNDEGIRKACEPTCPSYRRRLDAISRIAAKISDTERYTAAITMSPLLPTADPEGFARDLTDSGIRRFVIQPTLTGQARPGRVKAVTRNRIVAALAGYWNCPDTAVADRYRRSYQAAVGVIVPALEARHGLVGFGKEGFGLPWQERWHTSRRARPHGV